MTARTFRERLSLEITAIMDVGESEANGLADRLIENLDGKLCDLAGFLNVAKILHSIDADELADEWRNMTPSQWTRFRADPVASLIRRDEAVQAAIWRVVESRR